MALIARTDHGTLVVTLRMACGHVTALERGYPTPDDGLTMWDLVRQANVAMLRAKGVIQWG